MPNAILSVDGQGRIAGFETATDVDRRAGVEFYNGILVPGLVNAHTHLELSYLRGRIAPGGGFAAFAADMHAVRGGATPAGREAAARFCDARMRAEGVVAAGDVCNGATTFGLKAHSAIRYHNFIEVSGMTAVSAAEASRLAAQARAGGLAAGVTPHSAYALRDGLFRDTVAADAAGTSPLSIHFMESRAERELYDGGGPLAAWYARNGWTVDFAGYGSPAGRIAACIPPDRPVLLVHATFATGEDVDRMADHFGDRATWVLCPRSNRHIESALPPVQMLRRKGVRIALGTDSLASNADLSLVEEMKQLPDVPLDELLAWATASGAAALGMEDAQGRFGAGMSPGVTLIEGIDWRTRTLTPQASSRRIV